MANIHSWIPRIIALLSRQMREFDVPFSFRLTSIAFFSLLIHAYLAVVHAAEPSISAQSGGGSTNSTEAERAILKFRAAPGLKIDLFASEPLLINPVSLDFDERGRAYVVETHRRRTSVYDIRGHSDWLDTDFSFRTVDDRLNFFKKVLVPENSALPDKIKKDLNQDGKFDYRDLEVESERVRLVEDRNGDGRADHSTIFAEGFNSIVSGVAAGVLAHGSNVWFTCIPDLWLLQDTDQDGRADIKKTLLTGFGVHISFGGHDLHGLAIGPDGKLYFSIADRGLSVKSGNRTVAYPDSGAIMRCNLDGSDFELFATGLRNPQELAFDQYGNLWTGDNNGDGGDKARWVYAVEGSESGWHLGWQHLPNMGAWNSEKLWELPPKNTASYILPPIAHIGHGPAGLAFYPGTGLPPRYQNHFFMCDFPGGVHSFALKPSGASYEVTDLHEFMWELYPVDIAFGVDGGAYVADWIQGWEKPGKGRIFRVHDPAMAKDSGIRETKKILAEGMQRKSVRELSRLLEHQDMRVRLDAQFALANKGSEVTNNLFRIASKNDHQLARLHAIWALGLVSKKDGLALSCVIPLLSDPDAEVRAQAAKVLGDARYPDAFDPLIALLRDSSLRVRFFAAVALGKLGRTEAADSILSMLEENADRDPFLRHAGVMALVWLNDMDVIAAASKADSKPVRLAAVLAMRRLARPEIAALLYDPEPAIVLEAARAIHDLPIESSLSQVANLITKPNMPEPVLRRALNANYRLGRLETGLALAEFAVRTNAPEHLRAEAVQLLGRWAKPPARDLVVGLWRPLPPRDSRGATLAIRSELPSLLQNAPNKVRIAAAQAAAQLELTNTLPALRTLVADKNLAADVRVASLRAMAALKDPKLPEAVTIALADSNETLRKEAGQYVAQLKPTDALGQIAQALEKGTVAEQQTALKALSSMENPVADEVFAAWLDMLISNKVPGELQLDLLEAASKRKALSVQQKLQQYEVARSKNDPLAPYRECLTGGDFEAGKKVFFEKAEAACLRCHKVQGEGGEVGPELTGIGSKQTREYILEAILFPNKDIAKGYENLLVTLKNGQTFAGQFKNETDKELLIISPEDGLIVLGKSQITSRERGASAMPAEMGNILSKRDLRDLVEYLARLK